MALQRAGGAALAAGSRAGPLSGAPSQRWPRAAAGDPLRPPRYLPPQASAGEEGARAAPGLPTAPARMGSATGRPAPAEPPPASPNRLKRGRNKTANLD